jgi:hypothetical protein
VSAEIALAFRQQIEVGASGPAAPPLEQCAAELAGHAGVLAVRAFSVRVVKGERTPASYPELVICELDDAPAGVAAFGSAPSFAPSQSWRFVAWHGCSVGPRSDFELPEHLYLNLSAAPPSLSFAAYSDWYQRHQQENIAHSAVLRRGWRYRLTRLGPRADPGPSHLAAYELDGTLEALTADLDEAMRTGGISLPDWFDRFASLEAVAVGDRESR